MAPTQVSTNQIKDSTVGTVDVADGAITLAKLSALAANSIIGNNTASPATPIALTAAQVRTLINVADGATANLGTVTSVSVTTANGVSGTVATATTTPAITLTLGNITPTTVTVGADSGEVYAFNAKMNADTSGRMIVTTYGRILVGPGGVSAIDTIIERIGTGQIQITNDLRTVGNVIAGTYVYTIGYIQAGSGSLGAGAGDVFATGQIGFNSTHAFQLESTGGAIQNLSLMRFQSATSTAAGLATMITGDTYSRWKVVADGSLWWGEGAGNQDVQLKRETGFAAMSFYLTGTGRADGISARATVTMNAGLTDGYAANIGGVPVYNGAYTVTRHNYMNFPNVTGTSTVTAAALVRFDAAVGTHKALAANGTVATTLGSTGPTGSTAGAPQGWIRINVNGTLRFIPFW